MQETTIPTEAVVVDQQPSLPELIQTIISAREDIAANFLTIGEALSVIKQERLFESGGFDSFSSFLKDPRINIAWSDADRFMALTEDPEFQKQARLGISKMLELLKLPPAQRQKLMSDGLPIKGQVKTAAQMSMSELKSASRELKREGKQRCDRCGRWVDLVQEIDGKFYGAGGAHSCYELEMEERRAITAGRIPAAQLDKVLDGLRMEGTEPNQEPIHWLPDSLYQLYGQILQEQNTGEVSAEALKHEETTLKKLVHLCQVRLREIQDTFQLLKEMDADDA